MLMSPPLRPSPIVPTVDFDARGVQHGHLRLPYSRDDSAWGSVMIPICVIANGEGPTALMTGANHGDEYEGPAALFELARTLTGEAPPFATLAYVWDTRAPVGHVVVHPRTDRMRKIVVESGPDGMRRWRRYRRSLVADYQLAFGEAAGPLLAVAVMTDGDNTGSRLTTHYRDIVWR